MMIRGQLSRLFDLDAPEASVENAGGDGSRLRVPTVDERVNLFLQAVHGHVDVRDEMRSRIRKVILNAMALDVATSSEIDKLENISGPTSRLDPDFDRFDGFAAAPSTELSDGVINGFSAVSRKDKASYEAIRPAGSHFTQTTDQRSEVAADKSLLETLTTHQPVAPSTRASWFSRRTLVIATSVAGLFMALLLVKDVLFETGPSAPSVAARQADLLQDGPQTRKGDRQPLAHQQPSPDRSMEPSPRRPEPQGAAESQALAQSEDPLARVPLMSFATRPASPAAAARGDPSVPQGVSRVTKREVPTLDIEETVKRGRELLAAGEISLGRLVLERAVVAGSADAALSLGASYDPNILNTQKAPPSPPPSQSGVVPASAQLRLGDSPSSRVTERDAPAPDIKMAQHWYEKARNLGSTEAAQRLEKLEAVEQLKKPQIPDR